MSEFTLKKFKPLPESRLAHQWLDELKGIEIGPSAINPFGLDTRNVGIRDEIYENEQLKLAGKAAPIEIEAKADEIPLPDESEDFVLSSHVIEHCPNVVKTLTEWYRVIKKGGFIFMIAPLRDAASSDRGRSLTTWEHIHQDYLKQADEHSEPEAGKFGHCHYHVFDLEHLQSFVAQIFGDALELVDHQEKDDKVGNGFTLVYRKKKTLSEMGAWGFKPLRNRQNGSSRKNDNLTETAEQVEERRTTQNDQFRVSAIVSAFNSEAFLRGCLQDLVDQTLFQAGELEIVVVDSGSSQREADIVREFQAHYRNVTYVRTEFRETVYQAWNRGIRVARGKFITTSNTDDRHRKDALARLACELEKNPRLGLVYADVFVTNFENQEFGSHIHCGYHIRPDYSPEIMLSGCHMGPQPMWRREIHRSIGMFDSSFTSAGDYEFWCRLAQACPMKHVSEFLGLYFENPQGVCNSNKRLSARETIRVQKQYKGSFPPPGNVRNYIQNYQYHDNVPAQEIVNIGMITFNRVDFTRKSISSLVQHTRYPYVLTVVDNNSHDGTRDFLLEMKSKGFIRNLVLLNENVGVAKASNLAWKIGEDAGYYLKLDNDIVIRKYDWLENMVKLASASPRIGAVAYNFEPYSYPLTAINGLPCRIKIRNNLGGACVLIPRSTREQLGYWCETYGLYGEEDADYGERIRLKGLLNVYMEDENIGLHLPAGKAAAISLNTLAAKDGIEEIEHDSYRRWKDDQRRKIVQSGCYKRQIEAYRSQRQPLYQKSQFAEDYLSKKRTGQGAASAPADSLLTPAGSKSISARRQDAFKTSVVIVTYNSAEDIRACIESIQAHTIYPHEIIVIDNGSIDQTRAYLQSQSLEKIVFNSSNVGFAKGCNQGIDAAEGEYIVLLNPDTRVTAGWDENLIQHIDDTVGAVGPVSNFTAGKQKYEFYTPLRLEGMESLETLSRDVSARNKGKHLETKLLIGFCLMVPRRIIQVVGKLDEDLFLGNDDLEYSLRLRLKGYKLLIATDTFIYHKGQASFSSEPSEKTRQLVQASTDMLYRKLVASFGAWNLPSVHELWGMSWFKPSMDVIKSTKLVSIVVLTYNQVEYTQKCIASLAANTSMLFELIIVDNGSTDGTVTYIEKDVKTRYPNIPTRLIKNQENLGYATGNNIGIREAKGDYILLLNNDVVVTPGWLQLLVQHAERDRGIGIVGPMTSQVSGRQRVREVSYDPDSLTGLEEFAKAFSERYAGKSRQQWKIVGFCMLIRREVIQKIGGLDPRFGIGNFEDDDFCLRAYLAGFNAQIVEDVYVHHFGGATFKSCAVDYQALMNSNRAIFCAKWNIPLETCTSSHYTVSLQGVQFDSRQHYVPLETPEIDNGATDQPINEQRNSLGGVSTSGETLEPDPSQLLPYGGQNVNNYEQMYDNIQPLLRSSRLEDAVNALQNVVGSFPEFARGHNDLGVLYVQMGEKQKALGHLERAVSLRPQNSAFRKNLADFYFTQMGRAEDAVRVYEEVLQSKPGDKETLMTTAHLLVALKRFEDAKGYYQKALAIEPWNAEARDNLAKLQRIVIPPVEIPSCEALYQNALKAAEQGDSAGAIRQLEHLTGVHPEFALAHNDLGVLYYQSSQKERALQRYEEAARLEPANMTFIKNLADFYYVEQGRVEDALRLYIRVLEAHPEDIETLMTTARICTGLQLPDDARVFYERILEIEPWNSEARGRLDQLSSPQSPVPMPSQPDDLHADAMRLAAEGKPEEAKNALERLVAQHPDSALAHNDLGILYYQSGDKQQALRHYERAAQLDRSNLTFLKNLADCYWIEFGRLEEALRIYVEVLSAQPRDLEALHATGRVCVELKQYDDARVFFEKALEIEPWNKDAREQLERLESAAQAA